MPTLLCRHIQKTTGNVRKWKRLREWGGSYRDLARFRRLRAFNSFSFEDPRQLQKAHLSSPSTTDGAVT